MDRYGRDNNNDSHYGNESLESRARIRSLIPLSERKCVWTRSPSPPSRVVGASVSVNKKVTSVSAGPSKLSTATSVVASKEKIKTDSGKV